MKIPRKNISRKIADIRNPKALRAENDSVPKPETVKKIEIGAPRVASPGVSRHFPWVGLIIGIIVLAIFGGGFFLFSKYEAKKSLLQDAQQKFNESGFGGNLNLPGSFKITSFADVKKLWPFIKGSFGVYQGLGEVASVAFALSDDLTKLQTAVSENLAGAKNGATLSSLRTLNADLTAMREATDKVDAQSPDLKNFLPIPPDQYAALKYELRFWEEATGNLVDWLSSSDRNAVIFLENSSELRPTGGFWGSFAEVELNNGDIVSSSVRDINEIDKTLQTKIVPPKPLQLITTNWKTADSNWFFNFPDSATKAKQFLDSSGLYSTQGKKTDLIAAVTPKVISDLLTLTGPIMVSSSKVAVDKDNFLPSIQAEVQAGQSSGTGQAKKILKDLFPALISKLQALGADEKNQLLGDFINWAKNKDIMLWTEDGALQSAIEAQGAAGSIFQIPQKFNGDYLSVVAANIGGQKSDYVMSQNITFESQINLDGTATNKLTVVRTHNGKSGDKWWYAAANQAYLKLFVSDAGLSPEGTGGLAKIINAPVNYKKSGYATDTLVSAIEGSATTFKTLPNFTAFKESGKTVLTTWVKTAAGKSSAVGLNYSHRLFLSPADGVVYQFVFDKQPGVNSEYNFNISAPVGFVWGETNSPVYEYKGQEIPSRLTLNLTLKKASN